MKNLLPILMIGLLLVLTVTPPARAADDELLWREDLKEAIFIAQEANKPILIEFWATWCEICAAMDAEVFNQPRVITMISERAVPVRIDYDKTTDWAHHYDVPAVPYFVFANPDGVAVHQHSGYLDGDALERIFQSIPEDLTAWNQLIRTLEEKKPHYENLMDLGHQLRAAGFYANSNGYLERASKQKAARQDQARMETILFAMARNSLELLDGKSAESWFNRLVKDYPASPGKPDFLLGLGRAYSLQGKREAAVKAWNTILARFPASEAAAEAKGSLETEEK
jgi:thioredoxin-like negative regulator of GroEL